MADYDDVGLESFSLVTDSTMSLMEPPSRLEREYKPLKEIYASHSEPLPMKEPGIKECNSEALIQALKALQLKIKQLEHERLSASDHFKQLSKETQTTGLHTKDVGNDAYAYTSTDDGEEENIPPPLSPGIHIDQSFDRRFASLDTRFALQAKELDLLKDRLKQAENDKEDALKKTKELERKLGNSPKQMEELEMKLKASNAITNSKIKELEGKFLKKQWEKRRSQGHSSNEVIAQPQKKKKEIVKTRSQNPAQAISCSKPVPGIHYHLNMKDIPFVVGTSTTPSHSVSANYQKVLSLMKDHNKLLCGAVAETVKTEEDRQMNKKGKSKRKKSAPSGASLEELKGLTKTLEEEFAALTFHHHELSKTIQEHHNNSSVGKDDIDELEAELGDVIVQLESKMEQIEIIKKLLAAAKKKSKKDKARSTSEMEPVLPHTGGKKSRSKTRSSSCHRQREPLIIHSRETTPRDSLHVLKGMKRLQTTLQREDLCWR